MTWACGRGQSGSFRQRGFSGGCVIARLCAAVSVHTSAHRWFTLRTAIGPGLMLEWYCVPARWMRITRGSVCGSAPMLHCIARSRLGAQCGIVCKPSSMRPRQGCARPTSARHKTHRAKTHGQCGVTVSTPLRPFGFNMRSGCSSPQRSNANTASIGRSPGGSFAAAAIRSRFELFVTTTLPF